MDGNKVVYQLTMDDIYEVAEEEEHNKSWVDDHIEEIQKGIDNGIDWVEAVLEGIRYAEEEENGTNSF